jgi:predicted  nucleic acid-binding Zn-ribbon protein
MTLKEQSSTIDRLSKENFDLKMRIHFLNEALNKRSEEGIKEMISENVELKSDKIKLQKENQGMKRTIRNLEKQLKDSQSNKGGVDTEGETSEDDKRNDVEEEELIFLRERIETYEVEIERLRTESIVRESEKRRLAEIVKSMGENRPADSEAGAREERVRSIRSLIEIKLTIARKCGKTCLMLRRPLVSRLRMRIASSVTSFCA